MECQNGAMRVARIASLVAAAAFASCLTGPVLLASDLPGFRTYCGSVVQPRTGTVFLDPINRPAAEAQDEPFAFPDKSWAAALLWEHRFTDTCDGAILWRAADVVLAGAALVLVVITRLRRRLPLAAVALVALGVAIVDGPVAPLVAVSVAAGMGAWKQPTAHA